MFHRAVKLTFCNGTTLEVQFQDGNIKQYDMSVLFGKYPQLTALKDRNLFTSGKLIGFYGIVWNDDLDIETETIYQDGITVRKGESAPTVMVGDAVLAARAKKGISQIDLAKLTGINQADISRIERGIANPSVITLDKIAKALDTELKISMQ